MDQNKSSLPSGVRLVRLLNGHLREILGRERPGSAMAHLYCTGPYWVAFDRSAYRLRRSIPDSEVVPMRLLACPFPVVMVSVSDRSLRAYAGGSIPDGDETEHLELPLPVYPEADYRAWHAGEVAGLPSLS